MTIYTPLSLLKAQEVLACFPIDAPKKITPLTGGTTNSNYRIHTNSNDYVFTILEPKEEAEQIPWLEKYLNYLSCENIPVPTLIKTQNKHPSINFERKTAILTNFFRGTEASPSPLSCLKAGETLAKMNMLSENYPHQAPSPWGVSGLLEKRRHIEDHLLNQEEMTALEIFDSEIKAHDVQNLTSLPHGVIHSDLFPDNLLFQETHITAVIDFYKAGRDALAYDLAMGLMAWGFDDSGVFNRENFKSFYGGYTSVRPLTNDEFKALPQLASRACATIILMRILQAQKLKKYQKNGHVSQKSVITSANALGARSPTAYLMRLNFLKNNQFMNLLND